MSVLSGFRRPIVTSEDRVVYNGFRGDAPTRLFLYPFLLLVRRLRPVYFHLALNGKGLKPDWTEK